MSGAPACRSVDAAVRGALAFAVSLTMLAPARTARADPASDGGPMPVRFAIVIGNNQAESERTPSLRYADDDAVATHQLLVEAGVDSWLLARLDADSQRLHPGITPAGPPRGADLDRALATLSQRMRERTAHGDAVELLFFYSGHGDVDQGEGYVVLEDTRLTRTRLHALLVRSPATRNHVIIDACKSYFLAFDRGPGGRRESYAGAFALETVPAQLANTGFVLSTSSGRDSHEWERFQAGILSHEVRSALRGAADADRDGRVTYGELGAFLASANQEISNPRYRPEFTVRPPGRNLRQEVLRWGATAPAAIRIEAPTIGHVYVETARGQRLLDAHPSAKQALLLHVPAGRPLFVRRHDESAEQVVVEPDIATITALTPARPAIAARGALHLAFEQLFAAPFGTMDVDAYQRRYPFDELGAPTGTAPAPASAPPHNRRRWLGLASGAVAIAGGVAGLTTSVLALQRYESGAGASQQEIARLNRSVTRLDTVSIACFAVAGAAGLTWIGTRWFGGTVPTVEPAGDNGMMFGLGGGY